MSNMKQLTKKEIKHLVKESDKRDKEIYLILENIQYARNVASIFRTADAAGVKKILLTGISKTPPFGKELKQVSRNKEGSVEWKYYEETFDAIKEAKQNGFLIVAIELTDASINLYDLQNRLRDVKKICFVAGSEVFGIKKVTLERSDLAVTIPMYGRGASLNVSTSVGIALYSI